MAAARVFDAGEIQESLDRPVLAEPPVQAEKHDIRFHQGGKRAEHLRQRFLRHARELLLRWRLFLHDVPLREQLLLVLGRQRAARRVESDDLVAARAQGLGDPKRAGERHIPFGGRAAHQYRDFHSRVIPSSRSERRI